MIDVGGVARSATVDVIAWGVLFAVLSLTVPPASATIWYYVAGILAVTIAVTAVEQGGGGR